MVTLVKEDGTGLSNSNTYALVSDAVSYASNAGVTLPNSDGGVQITTWLLNAMKFLESNKLQYVGVTLNPPVIDSITGQYTNAQALSWPRANPFLVFTNNLFPGAEFAFNGFYGEQIYLIPAGVPQAIIDAQCQLVIEQFNSIQILPQSQNGLGANGKGFVTMERFDVMQRQYSITGLTMASYLPYVMDLISDLLVPGAASTLRTVRV